MMMPIMLTNSLFILFEQNILYCLLKIFCLHKISKYDPDPWSAFAVYKVFAKKAAFRDLPIELTDAAIFSISREMKKHFWLNEGILSISTTTEVDKNFK